MKRSKRIFDLLVAVPSLVALAPVFILVAIAIKLDDGGTVFYRQLRIGRAGKPFRIWKFRSMVVGADQLQAGLTGRGDARVTRLGRFLRHYKVDELPQLLNVLVGEMSLVGPRPEVPEFVDMYSAEQRRVLDYAPGITDVASIAYRNEEQQLAAAADQRAHYLQEIMPRKIALNLSYLGSATRWSDMVVIVKTFIAIAR